MRKSVRLFLLLLFAISIPALSAAAQEDYASDWNAFRARYKFHIQTIAISRPHENGSRSLIISEPPPHMTLDGLLQIDPFLKNPHVMTQHIGHDGWVKDVLFELPALSERELDSLSIKLSRYLFFTAYKTSVLLISPSPGPAAEKLPLDLKISAAQLRSWTSGGVGKFVPLLGGAPQDLSEILQGKPGGVFFSSSPGLVLWAFPSHEDLAVRRIEAREFAMDSDVILGAISNGAMVGVIARERVVPCDVVPPLRVETILLLASAKTDELAQSYERRHFAAGKFDSEKNADWAPIYLSDQLIDTEYGSLLNITDQLLKSWSLNDTVTYENFDYPKPRIWPFFPKPLDQLLDVPELTFNWNTTGAGYSAEGGEFTILALNRTGALPVSYIPEGQTKNARLEKIVADKEDTAYRQFAQMNDPNLVRVVQYASLYQIFRRFNVTATVPAGAPAPSEDVLTNEVMAMLRAFSELTEEKTESNLKALVDKKEITPAEVVEILSSLDRFADLQEMLRQAIQRWGDPGLRQLAEMLVSPRGSADQMEGALKRLFAIVEQLPDTELEKIVGDMSSAAKILAALGNPASPVSKLQPEDQRVLALHAIASDITDARSLVRALTGTAVASLKTIYEGSHTRLVTSWIHTSSIVVSFGTDVLATGGHNIDARVTEFRESNSVPRRTVRVIGEGDDRVVLYNPADRDFPRALTRYAARYGRDLSNEALQRILTERIPPPGPPLPRNVALGFTGTFKPSIDRGLQKNLTASRTAPIGLRTTSAELTPVQTEFVQALQGEKRSGTVVERRSADSILIYNRTTGHMVEATDISGAIDAIGQIAISEGGQGQTPVFFFRKGFSEAEAESMGVAARSNADADLVVEINPSSAEEMRSLFKKDLLDFQATELDTSDLITKDGSMPGVEITAKTPFRSMATSFVWKIRVFFKSLTEPIAALAGKVRAAVQEVIARCTSQPQSWSMAEIASETNQELRKRFGDNVQLVMGQTQNIAITELRRVYAPVG